MSLKSHSCRYCRRLLLEWRSGQPLCRWWSRHTRMVVNHFCSIRISGKKIRVVLDSACPQGTFDLRALHVTDRLPHPSECQLYYVNRDTLFSYHKATEMFLQVLWSCPSEIANPAFLFFLLLTFFRGVWLSWKFLLDLLIDIVDSFMVQNMMALYVASHYKNTPNDLQLMSDAPAHHLFVLLGWFLIPLWTLDPCTIKHMQSAKNAVVRVSK